MKLPLLLNLLYLPLCILSQQVADTSYNPIIEKITYKSGEGPIIFIDEGHHNFHTKDGRYKAFSNLLERDGYVVKGYSGSFKHNKLEEGRILVISNALNEKNVEDWFLPNPSAFTIDEIEVVKEWVTNGGRLFLIADHMPLAGAAEDLAKEFGFIFTNGFVFHNNSGGKAFFNIDDRTLNKNIITQGRNSRESVRQIVTFTGQALKIPDDATSILTFGEGFTNLLPDTAWVFNEETTSYAVTGWSQGAFKNFGKGKIVVCGEAAMFSAQLSGPEKRKMGMNNEDAPENYQLLLNIIHWLDDKL